MVNQATPTERRRGREPNQQRGRDRRQALLRAAQELLAERGVKAVTHRAVAARAGLPLASTTYYFTSIDELTQEALLLAVEERVALLQAFMTTGAPPGRTPDQFARSYVGAVIARPKADILAQVEVYLEAARNPALQGAASAAIESFELLAERGLAMVDPRDASDMAIAVNALLAGFALHRVVRPLPPEYEMEVILNALRALFVAHTADDAEIAEWQTRLGQEFRRTDAHAAAPGVADESVPRG